MGLWPVAVNITTASLHIALHVSVVANAVVCTSVFHFSCFSHKTFNSSMKRQFYWATLMFVCAVS